MTHVAPRTGESGQGLGKYCARSCSADAAQTPWRPRLRLTRPHEWSQRSYVQSRALAWQAPSPHGPRRSECAHIEPLRNTAALFVRCGEPATCVRLHNPIVKELLERLVTVLPAYFADLIQFTAAPKRFLATRTATWTQGLTFLAVSFLLTFIIQLPLTRTDPLLEAATDAAFVFTYVVLFGYAVILAWRAAGGRAPIEGFFAIHFYVAGVIKLLMSATFIIVIGVLRMADPAAYREMSEHLYAGDAMWLLANIDRLQHRPAWQVAMVLTMIGVALIGVWIVTTWGAFRQLNGLSRLRSVVAFAIFCAASVPVYIIVTLIAGALVK